MTKKTHFLGLPIAAALIAAGGPASAAPEQDRFDTPPEVAKKYREFQKVIEQQKQLEKQLVRSRPRSAEPKGEERLHVEGVVRKVGDGTLLIGVPLEPARIARLSYPRVKRLDDARDGTVFESFVFAGYRVASDALARRLAKQIGKRVELELEVTPHDETVVVRVKEIEGG